MNHDTEMYDFWHKNIHYLGTTYLIYQVRTMLIST